LTDTYELGGVDPTVRGVPYTGAFLPDISGSPKIGDVPTRTLSTAQGTMTGGTDVDSTTLIGRLGPNFRYHATEKFRLNLLGGVALGYADVDVNYSELRSVSLGGGRRLCQGGVVDLVTLISFGVGMLPFADPTILPNVLPLWERCGIFTPILST
jgi:hypothetical protein